MGIMKGTIERFVGSWGSGLGYLVIDGVSVPCENGPTVRALDACFGDVITFGHSVNQEAIKGKEIYWSYDEFGLILGGFTPVEDADPEVVEAYESQESQFAEK